MGKKFVKSEYGKSIIATGITKLKTGAIPIERAIKFSIPLFNVKIIAAIKNKDMKTKQKRPM